jgi:tetratricopeptide (TPR) repeat protein
VKLLLYIFGVALGVTILFQRLECQWVAFRSGEDAYKRGEYLRAATFYERAAQKLDDPRLLGVLGQCWLMLGRTADAEKVLARMIERYPKQLPAIKLLSGLYQQAKEPEKAIPLFARYSGAGGKLDSSAQLQLARIYRQAGRYEEAADFFLQADQDPTQKNISNVELAEMRSWQGRYDQSIDLFQQVLRADPANRQAKLGLARALSWAGRYGESVEEYKRLLNNPSNSVPSKP